MKDVMDIMLNVKIVLILVYHILEVSHLNFTLNVSEFWSQVKSEVSSQESEWNEKLVAAYINTNCESVLAGTAKLLLFFPILICLNTGISIYHHIQMQGISVMCVQAPQNGWHHCTPRSNDVVRSGASSPAIKNRTL